MKKRDLYEIHVTVGLPNSPIDRVRLESIAAKLHWTTSEIERDPVLGKDSYFYFTSYDKGLYDAMGRMDMLVGKLRGHGVHVIREKIELIVYDTKHGVGVSTGTD